MTRPQRITVVDSHTGGEPTRTVVAGGPALGEGSLIARRARLAAQHDWLRTALVCEPRGSEVMVGALLCEPADATCAAGVIFFNNVGYLNMCGHGLIGVVATLAYQCQIGPGAHAIETPAGVVTATLHTPNQVAFENVASYRHQANVALDVPNYGRVLGDIAWGGNWFFLVKEHQQRVEPDGIDALLSFARAVRHTLDTQQITGAEGGLIDHIELFGPASSGSGADSRSFVLCPGGAYDRSPCGTGTSAKLACLAADGKLAPGDVWRQESIIGSQFEAHYRRVEGDKIVPTISGSAYINAEVTAIVDPRDPFAAGIGVAFGTAQK